MTTLFCPQTINPAYRHAQTRHSLVALMKLVGVCSKRKFSAAFLKTASEAKALYSTAILLKATDVYNPYRGYPLIARHGWPRELA